MLITLAERCIGTAHIKQNKPLQDYAAATSDRLRSYAYALVADGHGGDKYIRSAKGAEIAPVLAVLHGRFQMAAEDVILDHPGHGILASTEPAGRVGGRYPALGGGTGLLLAVLAVYLVKKDHFLLGGISLAFSLGVYQSYLPFAMLLSLYSVWDVMARGEKGNVKKCMNYLYMGITGAVLYIVILEILLKIEGKVLDTYQGIDSLENAGLSGRFSALPSMYRDFIDFTFSKGFLAGYACAAAALVLFACGAASAVMLIKKSGAYKKAWFYWVALLTAVLVPLSANIVLFITPNVEYHLIMRYQWVLFLIVCVALCDRCVGKEFITKGAGILSFAFAVSALAVVIAYAVTDNIAYTTLQRKYEKTYAYAVRLLDRIEQTEGYYQGIPIAIMGVIGEDEYPPSEITAPITGDMIGYDRQYLIYTADNYEAFFKYYLGATLNFVSEEEENEIYYSDEYIAMESFPGETSVRYVDGVIWVKTEDAARD